MKVYLLQKSSIGDNDEVLGIFYSIVGAKVGAERLGLKIDWEKNDRDPKFVTKEFGTPSGERYYNTGYCIQEWEVQ